MSGPVTQFSDRVFLLAYNAATRLIPVFASSVLRRRLALGKEDPARWREKLGEPNADRPDGKLVWLHAVGLGEVLALRGLIDALSRVDPTLSFLVTSTARTSAQVMGPNLPSRTQHQFLPLDAPVYINRFLDHWRPDLAVWSEQDIWPNAIVSAHTRNVPVALVNARITTQSYQLRKLVRPLYRNVLSRMSLISAQERNTAEHLTRLGARNVRITGSLKSSAPPLKTEERELRRMTKALAQRKTWLAVSTHPGDETEALAAQTSLFASHPSFLLVLVPRDAQRNREIEIRISDFGLSFSRRSSGASPSSSDAVYLADTYGELGLWYRLADRALIGGGFDTVGGHNPWEAAALEVAVLHGPDIANFRADYGSLHDSGAAAEVAPGTLAQALVNPNLDKMAARAKSLSDNAQSALAPLAAELVSLCSQARV